MALFADRTLSPEQQAEITKATSSYAPIKVEVYILGNGAEIANLAMMLANSLSAAGWSVTGGTAIGGSAMGLDAVAVEMHAGSDSKILSAVLALNSVLNKEGVLSKPIAPFVGGVPFSFTGNPTQGWPDIRVFVGAKPK